MLENIFTLGMLIMLQAVLGIDNLLYISLASKNAPPNKQSYVRKLGIGLAIVLRIALLFALTSLIQYFQDPIISLHWNNIITGVFNIHSLIVYAGGSFIIYTALKEIWHMISIDDHHEHHAKTNRNPGSVAKIIALIVVMNLVFSFDSILSAIALTDKLWIMVLAIVLSGLLMIWLADKVSAFLQKNRMYEVLGLFILFLVGVMLITEAAHLSCLVLFNYEIEAMSKATFYFVIFILVIIDVVQSRYKKKLSQQKVLNIDN